MRLEVSDDVPLSIDASPQLAAMYHLSPFVWRDGDRYAMLDRVVNRSEVAAEKIARIHYGTSPDGLRFTLTERPVIAPGPGLDDLHGCEDPTVLFCDGRCFVYYTGWNEERKEANLLYASGDEPERLTKEGVAVRYSASVRNPKEASFHESGGEYRMYFEYSRDDRSWIGLASSAQPDGPWTILADPFALRTGDWDGRMTSPGPILTLDGRSVLFYNGAQMDDDWQIGWVVLDDSGRQIQRAEHPLVHASRPVADARAMAFASSLVRIDEATIWLYYSAGDMQMRRATIALR